MQTPMGETTHLFFTATGWHPVRVSMAQRRMKQDGVVMNAPCLYLDASFSEGLDDLALQQLVARLRVKALAVTVIQGFLGSMDAVFAPTASIRSRAALAVNSGPSSERT